MQTADFSADSAGVESKASATFCRNRPTLKDNVKMGDGVLHRSLLGSRVAVYRGREASEGARTVKCGSAGLNLSAVSSSPRI